VSLIAQKFLCLHQKLLTLGLHDSYVSGIHCHFKLVIAHLPFGKCSSQPLMELLRQQAWLDEMLGERRDSRSMTGETLAARQQQCVGAVEHGVVEPGDSRVIVVLTP
jgi:hypothetical protein